MPAPASFDYAIIRVVPRVERGEFVNVGVVLFCRTARFLGAQIEMDPGPLQALAPEIDLSAIAAHLAVIPLICAGEPTAGPIGALPPAERFHWLVSPRSAIVQTSPVHCGVCENPHLALDHLMETMVRR